MCDTKVYAPKIRARLGTAAHFCEDLATIEEQVGVWSTIQLYTPVTDVMGVYRNVADGVTCGVLDTPGIVLGQRPRSI